MYGCESWTVKKAECQKIDAFELWCWRRLLSVPWTARRSNQSLLKEISSECSLERLMLKLKLQYFGHLMRRTDSFGKTLMLGGIGGRRRRGRQRMRWLDGITDSMDMSLSVPPEAWRFVIHGSQRVGHDWATELNWLMASGSISSANEYSGLISFRIDWLDLQGTLKSLLQHHSSKASVILCSGFFIVQLSHPYMTTGKTIALTRQTSVGKVMSLLFNILSRLV